MDERYRHTDFFMLGGTVKNCKGYFLVRWMKDKDSMTFSGWGTVKNCNDYFGII